MTSLKISSGIAHQIPPDLRQSLLANPKALDAWENLTPIARNEWICWNISVKQAETRRHHIERTVSELQQGKRRPCCWMGCPHRTDKPLSKTQEWILSKTKQRQPH